MAYNIKLFVHGVPNGQDIWGNPGADAKYIEAFYGRKSNVASQMILEVMQFGGLNFRIHLVDDLLLFRCRMK